MAILAGITERKTEEKQGQTVQEPASAFKFIKALLLYSKVNQKPLSGLQTWCDAMIFVLTVIWRVDQNKGQN